MSGDTFASSRVIVARKPHRCFECDRTIRPGERYHREAGVWEGSFWHQRACVHCAALRTLVVEVDPDYYENYYGGLSSWVGELADEFATGSRWPALLRAVVNYRRNWTHRDGSPVEVPVNTARAA